MAQKLKSEIEAENKQLAKEKRDLEKQNKSLEEKMNKLEEMMNTFMSQKQEEVVVKEVEVSNSSTEPIPSNEYVRVTSLVNGKLNLSTGGNGRGTVFSFMSFGQTKNINYGNLEEIVNNNRRMAENGLFYIQNQKAVRDLMLEENYENVLTEDAIKAIVKGKGSDIAEMFELSNKKQREQIVKLIIKESLSGGTIDLNEINKISAIYEKDILSMISEAKSNK